MLRVRAQLSADKDGPQAPKYPFRRCWRTIGVSLAMEANRQAGPRAYSMTVE